MKKTNIFNYLFLLSFIVVLSFGCTKLLFEDPIPNNGKIVNELPDFFRGKFQKKDATTYFEIERIHNKHCIVLSYDGIHKDSLSDLIESLKNDSTQVEFIENSLILKSIDTTEKINLRFEKDMYYTEKEPQYELNLEEGYFIDDFENKEKKKALLKFHENRYYLNIKDEEEKWFAAWIECENNNLKIHNSFIADTTFVKNLNYYSNLTAIEKIGDKTFLANPTDAELSKLLEEALLFNEETWIRIDNDREVYWMWEIVTIALLLVFIIFVVKRKV